MKVCAGIPTLTARGGKSGIVHGNRCYRHTGRLVQYMCNISVRMIQDVRGVEGDAVSAVKTLSCGAHESRQSCRQVRRVKRVLRIIGGIVDEEDIIRSERNVPDTPGYAGGADLRTGAGRLVDCDQNRRTTAIGSGRIERAVGSEVHSADPVKADQPDCGCDPGRLVDRMER